MSISKDQHKVPTLSTPRLRLRPWEAGDAERLFSILQEPDILQYFPRTSPPQRGWVEKYIQHHFNHWQERDYGHWAVVLQQDDRVIGWTGLEYLPELEQTELAYLLSREAQGRGLATEAARAALAFGFETCRLVEIIGLVHPGNAASIHVLEKCGMKLHDQLELWGMEILRYHVFREK
jgi:[ribosomal protein S5]-alanine N-acetyltransferase